MLEGCRGFSSFLNDIVSFYSIKMILVSFCAMILGFIEVVYSYSVLLYELRLVMLDVLSIFEF